MFNAQLTSMPGLSWCSSTCLYHYGGLQMAWCHKGHLHPPCWLDYDYTVAWIILHNTDIILQSLQQNVLVCLLTAITLYDRPDFEHDWIYIKGETNSKFEHFWWGTRLIFSSSLLHFTIWNNMNKIFDFSVPVAYIFWNKSSLPLLLQRGTTNGAGPSGGLTHWYLVTNIYASELGHHWFRLWLLTEPVRNI